MKRKLFLAATITTRKISYVETPDVVGNFTVTICELTGSFMVTQEC